MGAAAAEVPVQRLAHLRLAGARHARQQRGGAGEDAREAVAALARLFVQQPPTKVNEESRPAQENENFLYTQREVITSTPVVAMTLGTPGIRDLKTFAGEDNLFQYLKKNLSVEVGKKDDLLSVQFDTPYREGGWTLRQVVHHLADAHVNAYVRFKLALTEACTNSVKHAYQDGTGSVDIVYELHADRLAVEVGDAGSGFETSNDAAEAAGDLAEGGLGIAIIRALTDEFELVDGARGGSRLRFVKYLDA